MFVVILNDTAHLQLGQSLSHVFAKQSVNHSRIVFLMVGHGQACVSDNLRCNKRHKHNVLARWRNIHGLIVIHMTIVA